MQHFTPRNSSGFQAARGYVDMPHAWRVRFLNEQQGWLQDERIVYDDGYTVGNATKFEGIDFVGVTHPDLIWKHGRYHIAQLRLRRETYELDTDFEHLVATRGDRVRVQHDVTLWGQGSGRVKAVDGQDVTLDEPVTMVSGTTYSIRFRLADGTTLERNVTGANGTFSTVTLSGSGDAPEVGDLFMFGEVSQETAVLRILAIVPRANLSARLILVDDAPEIQSADTGTIPAFNTNISQTANVANTTVAPISANETLLETATTVTNRVRISWTAPEFGTVILYPVRYRLTGTNVWQTSQVQPDRTYIDIDGLSAGQYEYQVRALFDNGFSNSWVEGFFTANIFDDAPTNVADFRVMVSGDIALLEWTALESILVRGYKIRYSPLTEGVSWSSASPLLTVGRVSSAQTSARVGTYLIRAETYANLLSPDPTIVVSTVDGVTAFNAVETITEDPDWAGTFDGTYVDDAGVLRLDLADDVFDATDWFEPGDFFFQVNGVERNGIYYFAGQIDLGDVYTSLVTVEIDAYGVGILDDFFAPLDVFDAADWFGDNTSLWSTAVEVATTDDDPSLENWSAWTQIGSSSVSGRAMKFRARLASSDPSVTPVVRALSVYIDMPDRIIAGNDLVVTTAGRTIAFDPPFRELQGLGIAAQGLDTGDYYAITLKSESGFTIIFRDASGTPVERTFDYVAKGYGKVI